MLVANKSLTVTPTFPPRSRHLAARIPTRALGAVPSWTMFLSLCSTVCVSPDQSFAWCLQRSGLPSPRPNPKRAPPRLPPVPQRCACLSSTCRAWPRSAPLRYPQRRRPRPRDARKTLQLTLDLYGMEINTRLNATKDRDSHYGVMSSHNPQRVANVAHGASVVPSVYGFFCVLNGPRVPLVSQVGMARVAMGHAPPPRRRAAPPRRARSSRVAHDAEDLVGFRVRARARA